MTRSKNFWAALAAISLAAAGFSGYSLYNRLAVHFSSDTLEILSKPVPALPNTGGAKEEPEKTAEKPSVPQPEPKEAKEEPQKQKAVKTVFEYKNASAKTVSLAGSFTKWKETKLTRKNGVWRTELYILPGNYLYHFVADGKKIPDPSKPKGPVGESIAAVEEAKPSPLKK
ncbi:MAG: glycogen-binding domain-containing protein [Elusimicrobiales bacterium]|jgi:hypothetical protein